MNKNVTVYLSHYLPDAGLEEEFVKQVVKDSMDPDFMHKIKKCTWDSNTQMISTLDDNIREIEMDLYNTVWYYDRFDEFTGMKGSSNRGKKRDYVNPEVL